jgi:hypothetical membrane protein
MSDVTRRRTAGTLLIAGGAVYFAAEFVAAAAWTDPPYSYTHHFISDLGVHGPLTAFGQYIYSPLAWVMNLGLFLYGLVILAGFATLPGPRRPATLSLATVLAAGSIVVALFPGDGNTTAAVAYHGLGAFAAFTAGNILAIVLGGTGRRLAISRALSRTLLALGSLGLLAIPAYLAATTTAILIGLTERAIIYPFLLGYMALGAALRKSQPTTPEAEETLAGQARRREDRG